MMTDVERKISFMIEGVCPGDGGGPIMMFTASQQWVLVGVIAFGVRCRDTGYPSAHVRITPYLEWFRSVNVNDTVTVNSSIPFGSTASVSTSSSSSTIVSNTASSPASSTVSSRSSSTTRPISTLSTTSSRRNGNPQLHFQSLNILFMCLANIFILLFKDF